ncbi:hypothetical protein H0274_11690 [Altererythrobacter sp. CC-YST694]|uniref:hypothetical protein n=1 Tax=Altererythrobacter sp. CC-YST694 TaxID=2755038 RepID=UPI001D024AF6|nr:hypothetical protein [Altererythrobacter sp. CC-YST694]MCB5425923.1 hypothetical protein [Altererythrobacter sp. CC-YST694]
MGKQRIAIEDGWPCLHLEVVLHAGRSLELLHHAAQREIIVEAPGELAGRQIAATVLNLSATEGGAAIGTSGGQSGSHIVREVVSVTVS